MKVSYRSLGRLTVPAALDAEEEALEGDPVTRGALQAQLLTCAPAGDDVLLGGGCSTHGNIEFSRTQEGFAHHAVNITVTCSTSHQSRVQVDLLAH